MPNKLPKFFDNHKICIICEGNEEYEYLNRLKNLKVWNEQYDISLVNAGGNETKHWTDENLKSPAKPVNAPLIKEYTGVENYKGRAEQISTIAASTQEISAQSINIEVMSNEIQAKVENL